MDGNYGAVGEQYEISYISGDKVRSQPCGLKS